jgi:hypothetical protein
LQTNTSPQQGINACNNRGTAANGVFYGGPCQRVIRRTTGARILSWKRADIQRGLASGSRRIATVAAITRQLLVKILRAGKASAL